MSIHVSWISISPHSTFCNRRTIFWTTFPSTHVMWLSSAKQLVLVGFTVVTIVSFGRLPRRILMASRNGLISKTASPILSSRLNVSLSYTSCIVWNYKHNVLEILSTYRAPSKASTQKMHQMAPPNTLRGLLVVVKWPFHIKLVQPFIGNIY